MEKLRRKLVLKVCDSTINLLSDGVKHAASVDCSFQQLAHPPYGPDYFLLFEIKSDLRDRKVSLDNEVEFAI